HIQNETGHKLPSGYPEGRRMWLNVQVFDDLEQLIYESGNYDPVTAVLTHDADIKVYEIKPGISNALAGLLDKTAGPSFHFVLNDTIYSDNRIPPRGFTNANFEDIQSPPVAYSYADGQFWDITNYPLPENRKSVIVTLYYQTTSKEYVEFLRDENITDTNGQEMYDLWEQNGKSTPIAMVQETWVDEPNKIFTKDLENGSNLLSSLRISGPNPFNNQIKLEYTISKNGSVEISVFNISGKKVAVLVNKFHSKGKYSINWIADDISSGTYFIRLDTRDVKDIQKVILLK
ncbi:MAG: T9SS type A sorting domain-containing protein, partial [Calditrichia bacterium]|nr:T9SS type A sorting domain-containing protein [Calditrichia bacterium]